jgi:TonB-dependent SusC/RagA subfamily outer membrane receptor
MYRDRQILVASTIALTVGIVTGARAQQGPQADSGRLADTAAKHPVAIVSGPATTIASTNAPDAVSVVTVSDSMRPPAAVFETLLGGRVPGVTIESSTSDVPGEGPQLRMRGVTSLNGPDAPLYIVDGVIVMSELSPDPAGNTGTTEGNGTNRIIDINPSDIASIQVLEGPSATAIYGAEGGAGVVIITTKHGTPGTTHWDLNGAVGHYSLAHEVPTRQFPTLASAQAWYVNDATHDTAAAKISADNAFRNLSLPTPQSHATFSGR